MQHLLSPMPPQGQMDVDGTEVSSILALSKLQSLAVLAGIWQEVTS